MPHEVRLVEEPPAGYALDASPGEGHEIRTVYREFTSSEDGKLFVSRLEGIPQELLSLLPPDARVSPSQVDHLVAIIRKDLTATVYINECTILAQVRAARPIDAGELLREDDIVDIDSVAFEGVSFPPDAGVVCMLSSGWRKGLFFDVEPLLPNGSDREYEIEKALGSCMADLDNALILSMSKDAWDFIERGWFPFVALPRRVVRSLVGFAKSEIDLDVMLPEVVKAVTAALPTFRRRWSEAELFRSHLDLLLHALDRFAADDHISCAAIVYPRIEGILRSIHEALGEEKKATQSVLARISTEGRDSELHENSWLLPTGFARFVEEAYFADFAPGQPAKFSRNSVGHGVATAEQFDEKAACLGLLTVDQLFFYLPGSRAERLSPDTSN